MKKIAIIMYLFICLVGTSWSMSTPKSNISDEYIDRGNGSWERTVKINDYVIRYRRLDSEGMFVQLKIYQGDKLVFDHIKEPNANNSDTCRLHIIGKDLTGNGTPCVLYEFAPHDYQYYIFSLGKEFKVLTKFYFKEGFDELKMVDLDGDGIKEIIGTDMSYRCFWVSCCCGPQPRIVLKYEKGKYHLSSKWTSKFYLEDESKNDQPSMGKILKHIFKLIYDGKGQEAYVYFSGFDKENTDKGWNEIMQQIKSNYFWEDIKEMNGW